MQICMYYFEIFMTIHPYKYYNVSQILKQNLTEKFNLVFGQFGLFLIFTLSLHDFMCKNLGLWKTMED